MHEKIGSIGGPKWLVVQPKQPQYMWGNISADMTGQFLEVAALQNFSFYILYIHHNADTVLEWLHKSFLLNLGIVNPDMYLGAQLWKTRFHNGVWAWAMSPVKYAQEVIRNCTVHLAANYGGRFKLPKEIENPFKMGYNPELDTSPELDPDTAFSYLTIIWVLRWMTKLGRTYIITKVSLLSPLVALPRDGHLDATVHVIVHVGQRYNFRLVYDPSYPEIDKSVFKK